MKTSLKKNVLFSLISAGAATLVGAAEFDLVTSGSTTKAMFGGATSYWRNRATGETGNAISDQDVCYVGNDYSLVATSTYTPNFPGKTLQIGDGSSDGTLNFCGDFACQNLVWNSGTFNMGKGGVSYSLSGETVTVLSTGQHLVTFTTATPNSSKNWSLGLESKFVSESADVTLRFVLTTDAEDDCKNKGNNTPLDAQHYLSGDNSGYLGHIQIDSFGHLAFAHDNAAGAPESLVSDKILLGANGRLTVAKNIMLNANAGITVTGDGARIVAKQYASGELDCTEFTLPMPITSAEGKGLAKYGTGLVTLAGAYSAGDLEVAEGTLVLAEAASAPAGLKVSVRSGAKFVQKVFVPGLDVTVDDGGTYERAYSFVVPYADGVVTPLDLTQEEFDLPLPLRLSAKIDLPLHDGARLVVAKLPADSTASAADFIDVSEKTYGLPKTSFEIEQGEDCKNLVLVARPTVVSVQSFDWNGGQNPGLHGNADLWSNGMASQPGFDYLLLHSIDGFSTGFVGDSVTMAPPANGAENKLRHEVSNIGKAVVYPGVTISPNYGGIAGFHFETGNTIEVPEGEPGTYVTFLSRLSSSKGMMKMQVNVSVSGAGGVCLTTAKQAREIEISGNNENFTGPLLVTGKDSPTEDDSTICYIGQPLSLGGAHAELAAEAVKVTSSSLLAPMSTMTLDTPNRGIYISKGGFHVDDGLTLTVKQPLKVTGKIYKKGPGTLVLDSPVTREGETRIYFHEGALRLATDAAYAGYYLCCSHGTVLELDPERPLTNGFGSFETEVPEGVTEPVKVTVRPSTEPSAPCSLVLCTVSEAEAALVRETIRFARVRGYAASLEEEEVAQDGKTLVRCSVRYAQKGMIVVFR